MTPEMLLYLESALALLCCAGYTWAIHRFCTNHFACIKQHRNVFLILLATVPSIAIGLRQAAILHSPAVEISRLSLQDWILLCYTTPPSLISLPLFWQCLLIFCTLRLYHGKKEQKILAAAFLLTTITLLTNFIESFLECLILFILHSAHIEYTILLSYWLGHLVCCINSACTIGTIVLLAKRMTGFFADRLSRWYVMLSVPLFGIVLLWDFIDFIAEHGIFLRGGDHLNLYYNELFSQAGICVLSVLCICGIGFYVFGMDKIDIEQKQKERYRSQVAFYQMLEEQYRSLERLRHDLKNHIIGLQQLTDNRERDKESNKFNCEICLRQTRNYLHKLADTGDIEYADDLTGKSIVDALLYYKHNQAKKTHIRWECDAHIPPECPVDDFDMCVIFGNLLDNALEACLKISKESDRFINIQAHMVKKCLLIEMINSLEITSKPAKEIDAVKYSGNADHNIASKSVRSALPSSWDSFKQAVDTKQHIYKKSGIGLRNVKDAIAKYNGTLTIDTDDNSFRISILIPCAPATHDINQAL